MSDEIKLKIVLDDGSIKEGFLSVEKQAESTGKKIAKGLDGKGSGFSSLEKGANSFTNSIENAQGGIESLARTALASLGPAGAITLAIAATAAATVKLGLAGEQVNAVNIQFGNIAKGAGLQVDSFKESIIKATEGLIDDEDALQIASKGIIALGENAAKLPSILDASRSISRALGKDFKDSFENLSQFVETGNAKILRQYGIILDLDSAYKKAAKSIGLTTAELSEQQKQTIRTNLVLDEIPKKFGAAAQSVTPLKDAFDRLKVSAGNAFEQIQSGVAESLTRAFIDKADLSNVSAQRLRDRLESLNKEAALLESKIGKDALDNFAKGASASAFGVQELIDRLQGLKSEQAKIASTIADQREVQRRLDQVAKPSGSTATPIKANEEQNILLAERRKKAESELTAFVSGEELKRLNNTTQIDQQRLAAATNYESSLAIMNDIFNQQKQALELQHQVNIESVKKQFAGNDTLNTQNRNAALLEIEATHQSNILALTKKTEQEKLATKNKFDKAGLAATSTALGQIATLQESSSTELAAIGKAAAITQATIDGYTAVQSALANVPYPFNFAAAALVGVAAAANVAKIAGVGGASKGSTPSFDVDGGIAATPGPSTELTPTQNLTRQEPGTQVSVVIQGDVLDSDESGSRIVSLINSAFDKKGVVISQGAFA